MYGENGVYAPDGWGSLLLPKLAAASSGALVAIGAFGDSVQQGLGGTVPWDDGYFGLTRDAVQAEYGDGGSGWQGVIDSPPAQGFGNPTRPTLTGTWTAYTTDVGVGGTGLYSSTTGAKYTESAVRGRYVDIHTIDVPSSGAAEVRIDGTLVGTINGNAAFNTKVTTYDRGAPAEGTTCSVEIRATSTLPFWLCGMVGRNTHGVVFHNVAKWGKTSALINSPAWPGATGSNTIGAKTMAAFQLDCLFWEMGGNDIAVGTTEAAYRVNSRYAFNCASLVKDCEFVGVSPHVAENDLVASSWHIYCEVMKDLCQSVGGAWINHWGRGRGYYNFMDDNGYSSSPGNVHPSNAGYEWMAEPPISLLIP